MEMDSSVDMKTCSVLSIRSALGPNEFAQYVLSCMPSEARAADLGCGRILSDWSVMLQTRYVLCDIYEVENQTESNTHEDHAAASSDIREYRIELKYGRKTSRIGDAVYCVMFLLAFWFLRSYFSQGFNVFFLILTGILAAAAVWLIWNNSRSAFGPSQCAEIETRIRERDDSEA